MLFTIIRDFFVEHVFGGITSTGRDVNVGYIGRLFTGSNWVTGSGNNFGVPINASYDNVGGGIQYIHLMDWLSTTATIISMIIILVLICLFIRWIFRVLSGALTMR